MYDGEIKMHSNKSINSDEYMVVLVKFPSNTFNAKVKENKNFNYTYYRDIPCEKVYLKYFISQMLLKLLKIKQILWVQ